MSTYRQDKTEKRPFLDVGSLANHFFGLLEQEGGDAGAIAAYEVLAQKPKILRALQEVSGYDADSLKPLEFFACLQDAKYFMNRFVWLQSDQPQANQLALNCLTRAEISIERACTVMEKEFSTGDVTFVAGKTVKDFQERVMRVFDVIADTALLAAGDEISFVNTPAKPLLEALTDLSDLRFECHVQSPPLAARAVQPQLKVPVLLGSG